MWEEVFGIQPINFSAYQLQIKNKTK